MTKCLISFLLSILYFTVIVPISFLLRLINKRIIPLKFETEKDSYWVLKSKTSQDTNDFYKQL